MKSASTALINYLNAARASNDAQLQFADAFVFSLKGGLTLCYSNTDITFSFTYAGTNYTALGNSVLVNGLNYKAAVGLEVDRQQITISALSTDLITTGAPILPALREGAFDGAAITRYRVFFSNEVAGTTVGAVMLFKGRMGPISKLGRTSATLTVNSDLVLLDVDMPRNIYQPTCLHTLYDTGCTMVQATFTYAGSVGAGSTVTNILWSGANSNFQQGVITFTSGVNAGVSATVGLATTGILTLIYPLSNAPATGDAFTVTYGCDHTPGTCKTKFNNLSNFRGFPYVPPPQMAF